MNIQLVDLVSLHKKLKPEIDAEMEHVLSTSYFINGPIVQELEKNLAEFLSVKHAIGCASGTDGLIVGLMALGVKPGDEVITSPFTFAATIEAILFVGAKPRYVDIDPQTFNLEPAFLTDVISEKTKVILPVHLYGQGYKLPEIVEIASKYNIDILEDNAQAFGATYNDKPLGTFGKVSATSFFPAKNLGAFGDAGGIFTDDDALADKLRMISQHGSKLRYHHEFLGLNSRLDALQAAVLKAKLPHLSEFNQARLNAANWYDRYLASANVKVPYREPNSTHIFHQYTIVLPEDGMRDNLQEALKKHGVPSAVHYPVPTHLQPAFKDKNYPEGSLPIAEQIAKRVLSLPMHTELTESQVQYVSEKIVECVGRA